MDVSDSQWQLVETLMLKENAPLGSEVRGGRPRAHDRMVLNGILWIMQSGGQWAHLPKKYGAYVTVWRRYQEWQGSGHWSKIWGVLLPTFSRKEQLEWVMAFLDGNFVPGKKV